MLLFCVYVAHGEHLPEPQLYFPLESCFWMGECKGLSQRTDVGKALFQNLACLLLSEGQAQTKKRRQTNPPRLGGNWRLFSGGSSIQGSLELAARWGVGLYASKAHLSSLLYHGKKREKVTDAVSSHLVAFFISFCLKGLFGFPTIWLIFLRGMEQKWLPWSSGLCVLWLTLTLHAQKTFSQHVSIQCSLPHQLSHHKTKPFDKNVITFCLTRWWSSPENGYSIPMVCLALSKTSVRAMNRAECACRLPEGLRQVRRRQDKPVNKLCVACYVLTFCCCLSWFPSEKHLPVYTDSL